MVIYDLTCSQSHYFEGWFKDLKDLNRQIKKNTIECPICGDAQISKRPSTFGMLKSKPPATQAVAATATGASPPQLHELMQQWENISKKLEKEFDDVGSNFTNEALKMHYGATPKRNIRGLSTTSQEDTLRKEGVDFLKVPLLLRKNQTPNSKN